MACPRNESSDYAVFLASYMRSVGDDIRFGFACINSATYVFRRRCHSEMIFFANSAAVLTFLSGCAIIFNRDKLNNWSFHAKKAWIYGIFTRTTLNQRFLCARQPAFLYPLEVLGPVLAERADEVRRQGVAFVNIAADLADIAMLSSSRSEISILSIPAFT